MTNIELAKKHLDVAKNYNTVYGWGCFGFPVTEAILKEKQAQYPNWYTSQKMNMFRNLIGRNYFMFDCVNLTKGIIWGWNGNQNAVYGGARYNTNGCPDYSADGMIGICKNVSSTGWDDMEIGEALWIPGHWGVYVGDGLAVECTPAWKNGVQVTAVGNIGAKAGYNTRTWKKHGKMPFITYVGAKNPEKEKHDANKTKVKIRFGFDDKTIAWLDSYKYNKPLFEKLANSK